MTKAELVEDVARAAELTKKDAERLVEIVFESIIETLNQGEKIELRGFGSFRVRERGARRGRNPKTGDPVVLKTNVLGLYRSHINKDVKPEDVTISCEKSGYRQERVFRRTEPGAMFIETDCTLRRL